MANQGTNVASLAGKLLGAVEDHWSTVANVLPLPERRGVIPGNPKTFAWDCEQLTVTLVGIGWGQALDMAATSQRVGSPLSVSALRHALFAVTLVRCTPQQDEDGNPPSMAELAESGFWFMRDAAVLSQAVLEFGTRMRRELPKAALCQAGAIEPIGPEGTLHGLETTFAITSAELE